MQRCQGFRPTGDQMVRIFHNKIIYESALRNPHNGKREAKQINNFDHTTLNRSSGELVNHV